MLIAMVESETCTNWEENNTNYNSYDSDMNQCMLPPIFDKVFLTSPTPSPLNDSSLRRYAKEVQVEVETVYLCCVRCYLSKISQSSSIDVFYREYCICAFKVPFHYYCELIKRLHRTLKDHPTANPCECGSLRVLPK